MSLKLKGSSAWTVPAGGIPQECAAAIANRSTER